MVPSDRRSVNALVSSSQHPTNCRCCAEDFEHQLAFMNSSSVPLFLLLCLSNRTSPTESQFPSHRNRYIHSLVVGYEQPCPKLLGLIPQLPSSSKKILENEQCIFHSLSFIFHRAPSENHLFEKNTFVSITRTHQKKQQILHVGAI